MSKDRAINHLVYQGEEKPKEVSPERWAAMLAHLKRECVTITKESVIYH